MTRYEYLIDTITKHGDKDECLLWPYHKSAEGHGLLRYNWKIFKVHRLALTHKLNRDIAPGLRVYQSCSNTNCYAFTHLHEDTENTDKYYKRFMSKVTITDNCWLYNGGKDKEGYGKFRCGPSTKDTWRAHRYSYHMSKGAIPNGLMVCHICDNPPCVRPEHLFLGTAFDNANDREAKGRGSKQLCKFTEEQALFCINSQLSTSVIAKMFHCSEARVRDIRKGRSWKKLPRPNITYLNGHKYKAAD